MKKRFLSFVLLLCMLSSLLPAAEVTALAAEPASDIVIEQRINELYSLLGGKYFTVNQKGCGAKSSGHGCQNCNVNNVIKAQWFKNIFGTVNPSQMFLNGGKSCMGFVEFATWYIFRTDDNDTVLRSSSTKYTNGFNYNTISQNAHIGDYIRVNGHSFIYIGTDKSGVNVLDCNGTASYNCLVQRRKILYNNSYYANKNIWISKVYSKTGGTSITHKSYTITFDANGGSVSPSTQTVAEGSLIGQLPTPTRTGYQFLGWFDSKYSGSMEVTPGSIYVNQDQTLYALWKPICTEHTYNEAGVCTKCGAALDYDNGFDSSAAGTYQVSASEAYVRTGPYEVKTAARTLRQGETVEIVGSVVNSYHNTWLKTSDGYYIYGERLERYSAPKPPVQEEAKSFQVILDDGYVCQMITVTNGQAYGTLPTPSRDGYEFDGWYTKQSGGEKITASTVVNLTSDQTLYAHWKEWGPWSEWSTTPAYASSTRQVETREVKVSDSYTEYRYGRYVASGHDCWCGKYLEGLSYVSESARLQYSPWSTTQYGTSGRGWSCGPCSARHIGVDHTGSDGRSWWAEYLLPDGSYYWQETQTVGAVYETQYRYRDLIQ